MAVSLVGLRDSWDVCCEDGKATPIKPHQMSRHALHCCYSTTGRPGHVPGAENEMSHSASFGVHGFQEAFPVGD